MSACIDVGIFYVLCDMQSIHYEPCEVLILCYGMMLLQRESFRSHGSLREHSKIRTSVNACVMNYQLRKFTNKLKCQIVTTVDALTAMTMETTMMLNDDNNCQHKFNRNCHRNNTYNLHSQLRTHVTFAYGLYINCIQYVYNSYIIHIYIVYNSHNNLYTCLHTRTY